MSYYQTVTVCSLCRRNDEGMRHQMPIPDHTGEDVADVVCVWPCRHQVHPYESRCGAPQCIPSGSGFSDEPPF